MKKIIFFSIALIIASCSRDPFRIVGKYSTTSGTPVYLIDLGANDTLGVTQVKDSSFSFEGHLEDGPVFVYVGNGRERVRFPLEKGTVKVDIDERTESGTPLMPQEYDCSRHMDRRFHKGHQICHPSI